MQPCNIILIHTIAIIITIIRTTTTVTLTSKPCRLVNTTNAILIIRNI